MRTTKYELARASVQIERRREEIRAYRQGMHRFPAGSLLREEFRVAIVEAIQDLRGHRFTLAQLEPRPVRGHRRTPRRHMEAVS